MNPAARAWLPLLPATCLLAMACSEGGGGLAMEKDFPCSLAFTPTGITLGPDPRMIRPDPRGPIARDSRGNLYTDSGERGQFLIWSPSGEFLQAIGRVGEGPGEFAPGPKELWIVAGDTLFVRDNGLRWSVFDPDHHFVRSFREKIFVGLSGMVNFLADGRIVGTMFYFPSAGDPPEARMINRNGELDRELGQSTRARGTAMVTRRSAYDGSASLWIAPEVFNPGSHYVLEQWDTGGKLINTIERRVSWYSPRSEEPPTGFSWPPYVFSVSVDSAGLLLVGTLTGGSEITRDMDPRAERKRNPPVPRFEVIDPATRRVLASRTVTAEEYPVHVLALSHLGYRNRYDADGFTILELITWELVGDGAACGGAD